MLSDKTSDYKLSKIIDELPVVFYSCKNNKKWTMDYLSGNCESLTGYKKELFTKNKKPYNDIIHREDRKIVSDIVESSVENKAPFNIEYRIITKEDQVKWVWEQGKVIGDEIKGLITDITPQKNKILLLEELCTNQQRTIYSRTVDDNTLLPNRQKLLEDLKKENDYKLAIINLVNFEMINEYHGYEHGDMALQEISKWLLAELKYSEIFLYKGAEDNFILLGDKSITKENFSGMCRKIINSIKLKKFKLEDGDSFNVNIRAGIAFSKKYYMNAKKALKEAKISKRDFVVYDKDDSIKKNLINNIRWTKKLMDKDLAEKIVLFAQPIVNIKERQVEKYECLVRYKEDESNIITPSGFLDIAIDNNLYPEVTKIVIDKAFEYYAQNDDKFSINLSIEDILDVDNIMYIEHMIREYDVGNRLTFEILETNRIEKFDEILKFIERVRINGVKIAIDDFGTGYSNFDYLVKMNADFVKIDGSITKEILKNEQSRKLVSLIVGFAREMNFKTVAEYVDSKEIYEELNLLNVDLAQGFYISEPLELK